MSAGRDPERPQFRVGDLVRFKHGRRVWRLARIHGRGISGELWKGSTAWGSRDAFFTELELVADRRQQPRVSAIELDRREP